MHNIVTKEARIFFIDPVKEYVKNIYQTVRMIEEVYNSPVCKTIVKNFLNSLRVNAMYPKDIQEIVSD